ncbi:hypothetical protein GALMADRAFT_259319 [Galerina marginata CBS 339.88]|uniref:Uncharacterized protein n=1 Tax=Galerina marginata (strain CBS 339.88) TaxID=685588 RepID=A0A067SIC2_GALM3|nr:hypothetical protein GALMADRAFT_259319 [Galerina marginata CBS 339.88]
MTKSRGFSGRRQEFIKSVRAKAHTEGTPFRTALESVKGTNAAKEVLMGDRTEEPPLSRRNMRGWYSDALVIDDGDSQLYDEDVYNFKVDFSDGDHIEHQTNMTISLLEVARPSKRKGATKGFEMIKKSQNAMLLGDEEFEIWEEDEFEKFEIWDDDWEQIYNEQRVDTRKSYSSVLRGNDR